MSGGSNRKQRRLPRAKRLWRRQRWGRGTGGHGGQGGTGRYNDGGGGGGWLSNGTGNEEPDPYGDLTGGLGGYGPPSFAGGLSSRPFAEQGGFGGGGGGHYYGGGGGYSGGGGGYYSGGGGGSYTDGSVTNVTSAVTQTGDGFFLIWQASEALTVVQATPSISSACSASAALGTAIADQATISAASNPTGTVTFNLYDNPKAAPAPLFADTENVSGSTNRLGELHPHRRGHRLLGRQL